MTLQKPIALVALSVASLVLIYPLALADYSYRVARQSTKSETPFAQTAPPTRPAALPVVSATQPVVAPVRSEVTADETLVTVSDDFRPPFITNRVTPQPVTPPPTSPPSLTD